MDSLFCSKWELDQALSLPSDVTQIGDKFSIDLDLYFTADDMADLFSFKKKRYERICSLVRTALGSPNISEVNDLTATLTGAKEFNYLSESGDARKVLYYMCTFNTKVSQAEQDLLADNYKKYE